MNKMLDNFLPAALFISLTVHTLVVCGGYFLKMPTQKQAKRKAVEITYRPPVTPKAPDLKQRPIKPSQSLDLKNSSAATARGLMPVKRSGPTALPKDFTMYERKPQPIRSMQASHRVSITPILSEKVNNPAYAAYNEMVRSRIKEEVYNNFSKMEEGSVYLTFVLASDGSLKALQIIDEKTHATQNLRDVSIRSLKQAQFPPFLVGMTLPQYTFNIEIQYQVNE